MIKGINKQVLEIRDTGTPYFEKAFLFVKPEYSNMSESLLHEKFISAFSKAGVPVCRRSRIRSILTAAAFMLASAGMGAFIMFLLK